MPDFFKSLRNFKENASYLKVSIKWLIYSCVIDKSWFKYESPGLNSDWFDDIRSYLMRNLNISLYINPETTSNEIGL